MGNLASFKLMQWIDDNRHLLKPPVLNQTVYTDSDFIIMIVGGRYFLEWLGVGG